MGLNGNDCAPKVDVASTLAELDPDDVTTTPPISSTIPNDAVPQICDLVTKMEMLQFEVSQLKSPQRLRRDLVNSCRDAPSLPDTVAAVTIIEEVS